MPKNDPGMTTACARMLYKTAVKEFKIGLRMFNALPKKELYDDRLSSLLAIVPFFETAWHMSEVSFLYCADDLVKEVRDLKLRAKVQYNIVNTQIHQVQ